MVTVRDQGVGIRDDARLAIGSIQSRALPSGRLSTAMSAATRELHDAIDAHARRSGVPYLHPDEPTVQLDLLGSKQVIEWQEGKAAFLFASEGCWSELPALYARYGTNATAQLIARLKALEHASAALVCDSGMQATALAFDALMEPGGHAVLMRQVYNKTRSYLEWMAARVGGSVTIVDDGDMAALEAAITPETRFVFAETFTNPLVRAQDFDALRTVIDQARGRSRRRYGWCSTPRSPRRGRSTCLRCRTASTSSSPAAPSRLAATIATCGATSRPTTPSLRTR